MRDPEQVWRLGLRLYDAGMTAAEAPRLPGAVREQAARLRALASTVTPPVAGELRWLADALDAELWAGPLPPLAEAEELVGRLWAGSEATAGETARFEEAALERLAALREADPENDRPLSVLAEWIRLRHGRR